MQWNTSRERRIRERILSEYLTFRQIREVAWRHLRAADAADARRLENEQVRREAGSFVLHDYTADRADLDRIWGECELATARAGIEALNNIRHAMDGSY